MSTAAERVKAARASRRVSLAAALGIDARRFASPADLRFAQAIEDGLERVELLLESELGFADQLADVTARYLFEAGGKRVRPALALLTAQLGDGAAEEIIRVAAAIEITHLASLYHDDVMDEADLRRNVPSAHKVWGNSVAIITGDLLFARASKLIASLGEDALTMQADTFERLCLGQLHETAGPRDGEDPVEHYLQVLADKTGSLIGSAAESGIRFSGADQSFIPIMREYGERVGVAFQLIDDVIDLTQDPAVTGKEAGTDIKAGVATLPMLLLKREAAAGDRDAAALVERIEQWASSQVGENAGEPSPVAELREHAVTERTREEAKRWAAAAIDVIDPVPAGPVKRALVEFANRVTERVA